MNRVKVLRDLEFLSGGLTTLKTLYTDGNNGKLYDLIQDWNDILFNVIDQIAKENDYAKDT